MMLGFILGPMLEENFRRTMLLSRGDFAVFFQHPISATLLVMIALFIVWQVFSFVRNKGATKPLIDVMPQEE